MSAIATEVRAPEATTERPVPSGDDAAFGTSGLGLSLQSLSVAAAAWLYAAVLYRIWDASLRLPLDTTRGDVNLIGSMVKTITERGWYQSNPRLGAPFGQQFYDFPHGGETIQLFLIKGITLFVKTDGLTMNLYYLGGFGALAVVTFLVLRHLRFGFVIAAVGALVYTFLPYHFTHAQEHLYRSTYYSAPLACLLLVWAQSWRARFLVDQDPAPGVRWWRNVRPKRVLAALIVCVIIAGSETMTTSFTITLLASAALVAAIRWREPVRLLVSGAMAAVILVAFLVFALPTLNYYRAHGTNGVAGRRTVNESEWYGLKLSQVVMPQLGHRSDRLSDLGARAQKGSVVPSENGQALGILGTAGFLGALYGAVALGMRRDRSGRRDVRAPHDRQALSETASLCTVLAVLYGTIGGFAILLAMAGFSQVRVWNRIVVIIAFFALVMVAMWSERLAYWVRRRARFPRTALGCLALAVLAFGLWDGVAPRHPPYRLQDRRWNHEQAFVDAIESRMPARTAIFQLPVIAFPEVKPPGKMADYDPFIGYLHDHGSLRWSYGAIKGRPTADWQIQLRDKIGSVAGLPLLLGMGFTGLWVDTDGYTDNGQEVRSLEALLGAQPLRSEGGRYLFYDLRPFKRRLGRSDAELRAMARRAFGVAPAG